jgi:hypothetical protein
MEKEERNMKKKIVEIIVLMLVATSVVSATNILVKENNNRILDNEPYEPTLFDWWCVDQKQTTQDGYGITLIPPETNAQSFTPTKDKLTAVALYLFKAGSPEDPVHITVSIRDNLTGQDLAIKTIDTSSTSINKATWVLFDFDDITITPDTQYYIVCSGDGGDATNAYCWLFTSNDAYSSGEAWHKATAGSYWVKWPSGPTNPKDFCFKTYFRKPIDISSMLKTNENMAPVNYGVDVPVWEKGDSWTINYYRTEFRYNGSTLWFKHYHNCSLIFTVSDDSGANYTVKITTKNNEGRIIIDSYQLKYTKLTKFNAELIMRKTDLGQLSQTYQWKGPVFWLIGGTLPFPAQFQLGGTVSSIPANVFLPFPFSAGDSGTLPAFHGEAEEKCVLYWGLITLINNPSAPYNQGTLPYHCEMANITVPEGNYNAYNVSIDIPIGVHGHYSNWEYYVPEKGYVIKQHISQTDGGGRLQYNIEAELVSTTYTP